jgi:hypothetical protein
MKNTNRKRILFIAIGLLVALGLFAFLILQNMPLSEAKAKDYIDADWAESLVSQEDQPQYLEQLSQKATYVINSIDGDDGYYTITVTVSAPDLKTYFINNSVHLLENVDDLDAFVCDCIEKSSYIDTVAEVYIYELAGEIRVSYSDTFVDAMHGGIISYSQEMLRDLYADYFSEGLE